MTNYYKFIDEDKNLVGVECDMTLSDFEPKNEYPWLFWVYVQLRHESVDGAINPEEIAIVEELQEQFSIEMKLSDLGVYVGSRLSDGWLEIYFYNRHNKGVEKKCAQVMKAFGDYAYETASKRDKDWAFYTKTLYPNIYMQQQIQSRDIIEALIDEEDDLSVVRKVEHYTFFQTLASRERFATLFEKEGYEILGDVEDEGDYMYGLVVSKEHAVDAQTVETTCAFLIENTLLEHGIYEGWSTTLAEDTPVDNEDS